MKNRFRNLSLQGKISSICIFANLLIFIVNIILIMGINRMSNEMEMVYRENLHLIELSDGLTAVQDNMTAYLNVKTSDALEDYYRSDVDEDKQDDIDANKTELIIAKNRHGATASIELTFDKEFTRFRSIDKSHYE